MILPEHLQSWQPQADLNKLRAFAAENATLLTLLHEAWQRFDAQYTPPPTALPQSNKAYAPEVQSIDELSHSPISHEEMLAFLNHFEKEREHNDRPFGNHVRIQEQNWEILDD